MEDVKYKSGENIFRIESRSRDLFEEIVLGAPLTPNSMEIVYFANGILPEMSVDRRTYIDDCHSHNVIPHSGFRINYNSELGPDRLGHFEFRPLNGDSPFYTKVDVKIEEAIYAMLFGGRIHIYEVNIPLLDEVGFDRFKVFLNPSLKRAGYKIEHGQLNFHTADTQSKVEVGTLDTKLRIERHVNRFRGTLTIESYTSQETVDKLEQWFMELKSKYEKEISI